MFCVPTSQSNEAGCGLWSIMGTSPHYLTNRIYDVAAAADEGAADEGAADEGAADEGAADEGANAAGANAADEGANAADEGANTAGW